MLDLQKKKSKHLIAMLANVMQMKFEHLMHMKTKSEHLICRRRNPNF